jgi:hypothetical protein
MGGERENGMVVRTSFGHGHPRLVAWIGYGLIAAACVAMIWALFAT